MGNLTSIAIRKHEGLDALGPNTCGGVMVRDLSQHGPIAAVVLPTVRKCPNHKSFGYTPPKTIALSNKPQKNLTLNNVKKPAASTRMVKPFQLPWCYNPLLQQSYAQMLSNQAHHFNQAFNVHPNQFLHPFMDNKVRKSLPSSTLDLPSPPNSLLSNPVNYSPQLNALNTTNYSPFQSNPFSTPKQLNPLTTTINPPSTTLNNQTLEFYPTQPIQCPGNQPFSTSLQQPSANQTIHKTANKQFHHGFNESIDSLNIQDPKRLSIGDTLNGVPQITPFEESSGKDVNREALRKMIEDEMDMLLISQKPHHANNAKMKNDRDKVNLLRKSKVYSDDEIDDYEDYRGESAKFRRMTKNKCFYTTAQWRDKKKPWKRKYLDGEDDNDNDEADDDKEEEDSAKNKNCKLLEFIKKFENEAHCKRMILISAMRDAIEDKRKEDHEFEMAFKEIEKSRNAGKACKMNKCYNDMERNNLILNIENRFLYGIVEKGKEKERLLKAREKKLIEDLSPCCEELHALKANRNNKRCLDFELMMGKPHYKHQCGCYASHECYSQPSSCCNFSPDPRRTSQSLPPHSCQQPSPYFISVPKNSTLNEKKENNLFYKNIGKKDEACIMVSNDVNKLKKAFSDLGTAYMIDNSGPEEAVMKIVKIDKTFSKKDQQTENISKQQPNDEKNLETTPDTADANPNQEQKTDPPPDNIDSLTETSTTKIEEANQEQGKSEENTSDLPFKMVEVDYNSKGTNKRKALIECEDTMKKILAGENFTVCRKQPCSTASCSSMIAEINAMARVLQRKAGPSDWMQFHPDVQQNCHFTPKKPQNKPEVSNFDDKQNTSKKAEKRRRKKKNVRLASLQLQQKTPQPPYSQHQQLPHHLLQTQQHQKLLPQTLTPHQLSQQPFYEKEIKCKAESTILPLHLTNPFAYNSFNATPPNLQDFSQYHDTTKFRQQCDYIYKHLKNKHRDSSEDSSEKLKKRKNKKRENMTKKKSYEFDSLERLKILARLHPIMPEKFKDLITRLPTTDPSLSDCNFVLEKNKGTANTETQKNDYKFKTEIPKVNSKSEMPEYHMDPCVQTCIEKQKLKDDKPGDKADDAPGKKKRWFFC